MPNISFENVKKVYPNGTYALDGVSFTINSGDFVCIVGESGGGKTTLLKLLAGLDTATSGEIYFDGEIANYLKVAKRNVAFVFQEYTIYPNMTVFENIVFSLKKEKYSYDEKCEIANDIIKKMNLEVISGELPKHLSFGQCQKVALARALVRKPEIILFDEPLSNIDVLAKNEYKELILYAKKALPQSTFVYVTHNIEDALKMSNKIMVIDKGKIIQYDQKQIVFDLPNSQTVADYMIGSREVYDGKIINGEFVCEERKFKLTSFQQETLNKKKLSQVRCYHTKAMDYYFDFMGNSIVGINKEYIVAASYENNHLNILGEEINIEKIKNALINTNFQKAILYKEFFSMEEIEDGICFLGKVNYCDNKYITVKINDLIIPFLNSGNYKENDEIKVYYPLFKLKALDKNNQQIISSYIISNNIMTFKVFNKKQGIIKVGEVKIASENFKKYKKTITLQVPIDAFEINDNGKFTCDVLYNEEKLSNKCLIHFETRGLGEYLSALVESSFRGFNKPKIRYNIDFSKIILIDGK